MCHSVCDHFIRSRYAFLSTPISCCLGLRGGVASAEAAPTCTPVQSCEAQTRSNSPFNSSLPRPF